MKNLLQLIEKSHFGSENVTAENLFEKFCEDAQFDFSLLFVKKKKRSKLFGAIFGEKSARFFIEKAESLIEGKFDLLGYENLDFGKEVDWHFEPIAGKRSPLKALETI